MINLKYFDSFPVLESERLIFRKFDVLQDADLIYNLRTNQLVMRFLDNSNHKSIKESQDFIKKNLNNYKTKSCISWVIVEKSTNQTIGDFSFFNINKTQSRTEVGYSLLPEFWNKGLMTETLKTLISFGFTNLKLHRLEADINPLNTNSKLLLKKIGFTNEGYFKENYYFDGKYIDSEIYSLLASNFISTKK